MRAWSASGRWRCSLYAAIYGEAACVPCRGGCGCLCYCRCCCCCCCCCLLLLRPCCRPAAASCCHLLLRLLRPPVFHNRRSFLSLSLSRLLGCAAPIFFSQLLEVLRGLMEGRASLKREVEQKGKYQRFLDSVCEDSSEYFESIENITMRYETLAAAHFDLRSRVDKAQHEQEDQTQLLVGYMKRSQNDLLVYNSDIANKQQELDARRFKTADGDAALYKVETEAKEGKRELGEIEMAIHNIHNRCVRVRGQSQHEGLDRAELQAALLEAIKQRVVDLQAIVREIQSARRLAAMQMGDSAQATAVSGGKPGAPQGGGGSGSAPGASGAATSPGASSPGGATSGEKSAAFKKAPDGTHGSSFGRDAGASGSQGLSGPISTAPKAVS